MKKVRVHKRVFLASLFVALLVSVFLLAKGSVSTRACLSGPESEEFECLESVLEKSVANKGVSQALTLLSRYRGESTSLTVEECHLLAHFIGDKAFRLYGGQGIDFGEKNDGSLCNYGFYHAFMTAFILADRFKDAAAFCETASRGNEDLASSCYHGIGHGAIYTLTDDLKTTGTFDQVLSQGEEVCKEILEKDFYKTEHCMRGIYGGISDLLVFREHSMGNLSTADYYHICSQQKVEFRPVCYQEMSVILHAAFGEGFVERVAFVTNSSLKKEYKENALTGLVSLFPATTNNKRWQEGIVVCKSLEEDFKDLCLSILAISTRRNAPQGEGETLLDSFCSHELLTSEEKDTCMMYKREKV